MKDQQDPEDIDSNKWKRKLALEPNVRNFAGIQPRVLNPDNPDEARAADLGLEIYDLNAPLFLATPEQMGEEPFHLVLRQHAKKCWGRVYHMFESGKTQRVTLQGNFGIGKTVSMQYTLLRLLRDKKCVVYHSM